LQIYIFHAVGYYVLHFEKGVHCTMYPALRTEQKVITKKK
jgi:hypothetical protein